uniref:Uncharacterized protein n=1 Tax=Megaselia scalaris TaxID=36166 RepID=T1GJS1_MEGSC
MYRLPKKQFNSIHSSIKTAVTKSRSNVNIAGNKINVNPTLPTTEIIFKAKFCKFTERYNYYTKMYHIAGTKNSLSVNIAGNEINFKECNKAHVYLDLPFIKG